VTRGMENVKKGLKRLFWRMIPFPQHCRTHICFCSSKGSRLWLVVRLFFYLFHIVHSTFISTLCFYLGLIQPLTSNLFTCECGHKLDTFGTHLSCCPFGGQQIATHDVIQNVMYALTRNSEHII
jgi:hypothetical protein